MSNELTFYGYTIDQMIESYKYYNVLEWREITACVWVGISISLIIFWIFRFIINLYKIYQKSLANPDDIEDEKAQVTLFGLLDFSAMLFIIVPTFFICTATGVHHINSILYDKADEAISNRNYYEALDYYTIIYNHMGIEYGDIIGDMFNIEEYVGKDKIIERLGYKNYEQYMENGR